MRDARRSRMESSRATWRIAGCVVMKPLIHQRYDAASTDEVVAHAVQDRNQELALVETRTVR